MTEQPQMIDLNAALRLLAAEGEVGAVRLLLKHTAPQPDPPPAPAPVAVTPPSAPEGDQPIPYAVAKDMTTAEWMALRTSNPTRWAATLKTLGTSV